MSKYEYYQNEYERIVKEDLERHPLNPFIINKDIWVCISWLEDIHAEPNQNELIMKEIGKLAQKNEFELVESIEKGIKVITI